MVHFTVSGYHGYLCTTHPHSELYTFLYNRNVKNIPGNLTNTGYHGYQGTPYLRNIETGNVYMSSKIRRCSYGYQIPVYISNYTKFYTFTEVRIAL